MGLKPSRGRVSLGPEFGDVMAGLVAELVVTRSVRDTAAVLDATAGPAPGDPYFAPPPARAFLGEVGVDPGRLRIGFRTRGAGRDDDAHPDCIAAVTNTAQLLEALGHDVEAVDLPALDDVAYAEVTGSMFPVFLAREIDRWSRVLGREIQLSELEPFNAQMAEGGRRVSGAQYLAATEAANRYSRGLTA